MSVFAKRSRLVQTKIVDNIRVQNVRASRGVVFEREIIYRSEAKKKKKKKKGKNVVLFPKRSGGRFRESKREFGDSVCFNGPVIRKGRPRGTPRTTYVTGRDLQCTADVFRWPVRTMSSIFHRVPRVSPGDARSLGFRTAAVTAADGRNSIKR